MLLLSHMNLGRACTPSAKATVYWKTSVISTQGLNSCTTSYTYTDGGRCGPQDLIGLAFSDAEGTVPQHVDYLALYIGGTL